MVEARLTRGPLPRAWTLATVAAVGLSSVGCTMCPDPFDYSGPVPNGSSPQNDFRARSNGILPLGAAPKPWPLIVRKGEDPAGPPQDRETGPTLADEDDTDGLQQTVAVLGESDDGAATAADASSEAVEPANPELQPVPAGDPILDVQQPAVGGDPVPAVTPVLPPVPVGETPGWRARRR